MTSFVSSPARSVNSLNSSSRRSPSLSKSRFGSSISSNVSSLPLYTTPRLSYNNIHLEERTPTMDCVSNAPNVAVEVEREFFRMNVGEMAKEESDRRRGEIEGERRRVEEFDRRLRERLRRERGERKKKKEEGEKKREKVRGLGEGAGGGVRRVGKKPVTTLKVKPTSKQPTLKKEEPELEDVTPVKVGQSFVMVEVPTPKEFVTPTKKAREKMLRHKK